MFRSICVITFLMLFQTASILEERLLQHHQFIWPFIEMLTPFLALIRGRKMEKEMATHSNVLAWRIPGTGEPGGLPSMGSHRVRQDWSDLAAAEEGRSRERRCKALDNYWVRCNSPHKRLPSLLTPITSAQDSQSPIRSDNSLGRSKQLNEKFFYSWLWFKHD